MTGSEKRRCWTLVACLWLIFPLPVHLIVVAGLLPGVMLVPLVAATFLEVRGFAPIVGLVALIALAYFGLAWVAGRQLYLFIHRRFPSHESRVVTVTACALVAVSLLPIYVPIAYGPTPNQNLPQLVVAAAREAARDFGLVKAVTNVQAWIYRVSESSKPLIERLESPDVTVQAWEEARASPPQVRDQILRELLSSLCTIRDSRARDQRISVIFYVVSEEILKKSGDYFIDDFLDENECPAAVQRLLAVVPTHAGP